MISGMGIIYPGVGASTEPTFQKKFSECSHGRLTPTVRPLPSWWRTAGAGRDSAPGADRMPRRGPSARRCRRSYGNDGVRVKAIFDEATRVMTLIRRSGGKLSFPNISRMQFQRFLARYTWMRESQRNS